MNRKQYAPAMPRGIIQDMRQLVRAYRLTKWVDERNTADEKASPEVAKSAKRYLVQTPFIMDEYTKLREYEPYETRDLIQYCVSKQYLEKEKINDVWNVRVNDEIGRDFLEPFYLGFILEFLKRYHLQLFIVFGSATIIGGAQALWRIIMG